VRKRGRMKGNEKEGKREVRKKERGK